MKNNLPPFKTFQLDKKNKEDTAERQWRPSESDPAQARFPFGISKEFSEERKIEWRPSDKFEQAPNMKYAHQVYDDKDDPSPLSAAQRGEPAPEVKIALPEQKKPTNFATKVERQPRAESGPIVINVFSMLKNPFDVFIRTETQMQTLLVNPFSALNCSFVSSAKTSNDLFSIIVAPLKNFAVLSNDRQEIKEYYFEPGPIGLEVEEKNNALVITGVVPNSQASPYECYIGGLEIIAVNGDRVTSISQFQELVIQAVHTAQNDPSGQAFVRLAIMSYKVPKEKLDELYNWGNSKDSKVKGLFGSLVKDGIDADHQHGIELHKRRVDSSDEEDDDDEEEDDGEGEEFENNTEAENEILGIRNDADDKYAFDSSDKYKEDKGHFKDSDNKDVGDDEATSAAKTYLTETEDGSSEMRAPRVVRATVDVDVDADKKSFDSPTGASSSPSSKSGKKKKGKKKGKMEYDSDDEEEGMKTKQSWEYTTALDNLELSPYYSTVCIPAHLSASVDWGRPTDIIAFGNFSRKLCVTVFWVDNDGALVFRKKLAPGEKYLEFISPEHVWVVTASKVVEQSRSIYSNSKILRSGSSPDRGQSSGKGNRDVVSADSTSVIFRASRNAISSAMSFVAIWSPSCSLSMSQRSITLPKENSKTWQERIKERTDIANGIPPTMIDTTSSSSVEPIPKINFQIFESSKI